MHGTTLLSPLLALKGISLSFCFYPLQLRQGNGYDVRHYEAAVWVYTDVRDIEDEQEATMMGYARLARYFNGENEVSRSACCQAFRL